MLEQNQQEEKMDDKPINCDNCGLQVWLSDCTVEQDNIGITYYFCPKCGTQVYTEEALYAP